MKISATLINRMWLGAAVLQLVANILLGDGSPEIVDGEEDYNLLIARNWIQLVASCLWLLTALFFLVTGPKYTKETVARFILVCGGILFTASSVRGTFFQDFTTEAQLAAGGASCFFLGATYTAINMYINYKNIEKDGIPTGSVWAGALAFSVGALLTVVNASMTAQSMADENNDANDKENKDSDDKKEEDDVQPPCTGKNPRAIALGTTAGVLFVVGGFLWNTNMHWKTGRPFTEMSLS